MRISAFSAIMLATASPCLAADAGGPRPQASPEQKALMYQVQECTESKTQILTSVFTLQAQVEELKAKLASETKRADEAQKKD